jgi:hypothetical protein
MQIANVYSFGRLAKEKQMSISELGSLGEFIGSIAVLVTLIYLVFQLRQNTLSMRSQSRYFVLEALNADLRQVQEEGFFEIAARANREDATEQDHVSFAMYVNGWFSHLEMLFLEIRDGALPKEFADTLRWRTAFLFFSNPNMNQIWEEWQGYYTSSYQKYVDDLRRQDVAAIYAQRRHY